MSPDLDTKIRNYGDQLDRRAASLETLSQQALSTVRTHTAPRRRWVLATGAAAILTVAVGGVALLAELFSGGGGAPVATAPDSPAITFENGTWQRTELETDLFFDVEATAFGLVAAAGQDGIWVSQDGQEWGQVFVGPHEPFSGTTTTLEPPMTAPPPSGDVETYIRHVAEYEGGLYAVATNVTGTNSPDMTGRMIVYRSEDGVNWEETVVSEDGNTLLGIHPADLVATDTGLIVYADGHESGTAVYLSEDGTAWTEVDSSSTGLASVGLGYGVTPYSGGFVAIADLPAPEENPLLGVYRSADGITWEPIAGATFGRDDYSALHPSAIVEHDGVLFLGGFEMVWETGHEGALWRSTDGNGFERLDLTTDFSLVGHIVSTPSGLLIVGWSWERDTGPAQLVLLASTDGYTFLPIEDPAGIFDNAGEPTGVVFGDQVLLFGLGVDETGNPIQMQWTWTPTD